MKQNSFRAIRYTSKLNLQNILKNVGDSINVFVPVEHFTRENPVISQSKVYGSRPYSITSDLVALCAHMGILLPGEKPKKKSTDTLLTAPRAPMFGRSDTSIEETRKIEDGFRFYGVVLSLIAVEGMETYPSIRGYCISSQAIKDDLPISLDVLDYSFISEFEPMPEIVEDPFQILTKETPVDYFTPVEEDGLLTFSYSPKLFKTDKEGYLFRDFKVLMFTEDDKILQFKWTRNNNLCLLDRTSDTKDYKDPLITGIDYHNVTFSDKGITVKVSDERTSFSITKIILHPPEGASID